MFLFVGLQSSARRGVMALWMGENSFTKLRFSHRVKPFSAEEEDRTVALFKKGAGSFSAAQEVQSIPMHPCCELCCFTSLTKASIGVKKSLKKMMWFLDVL